MNDAWDMPGLNTSEKMLLLAISDCSNNEGYAYPSYITLVKKTGMSKATLSKCMKILKGLEILKTESHGSIGVGKKVNTYTISLRCELPISSDHELIEKIKELRKSNSNAISSHLELRKVHTANSISSHREHEPSLQPPIKEPTLKDIAKKGFVLPEWIDKKIWAQWMQVRKAKKQTNTDIALTKLVNELLACQVAGFEPSVAMTTAVENSWAGLKLQWLINLHQATNTGSNYENNAASSKTNRKLSLVEQAAQSTARVEARERQQHAVVG